MFPREAKINESIGLMSDAIEATGKAEIQEFSYLRSLFRRADLFHVHWPDETLNSRGRGKHLIKVPLFLSYILLCKLFRRPIVWTVHNVATHEAQSAVFQRILWGIFLPAVDWAIHLCPASIPAMPELRHGSIVPHPNYCEVYEKFVQGYIRTHPAGTDPDRQFRISCFGLLRPYKGLENLIGVFGRWERPNARLQIGGAPLTREIGDMLVELAKPDPRATVTARALDQRELAELVLESDVIVLPYTRIMNSGVAAAALSLGRPILAPAAGCILYYHEKLGDDWVMTYDGDLEPRHLDLAFQRFSSRDRSRRPDLGFMEPKRIASAIVDIYQRLLGAQTTEGSVGG